MMRFKKPSKTMVTQVTWYILICQYNRTLCLLCVYRWIKVIWRLSAMFTEIFKDGKPVPCPAIPHSQHSQQIIDHGDFTARIRCRLCLQHSALSKQSLPIYVRFTCKTKPIWHPLSHSSVVLKVENAEHLGGGIITLEDGQLKYMIWGFPPSGHNIYILLLHLG